MLWRLDNSVMRADIDPGAFLSEVFEIRNEISDLREVASDERLTTLILHALPEEMYSTVKVHSTRDPNFGLEEIISMAKKRFYK